MPEECVTRYYKGESEHMSEGSPVYQVWPIFDGNVQNLRNDGSQILEQAICMCPSEDGADLVLSILNAAFRIALVPEC